MKLPESITLMLHADYRCGEPSIHAFSTDMTDYGYAYLGDVTVQVPQVDPRPQLIEMLRKEKQKLLANAQMKASELDERIQSLLALEHKADAATQPAREVA